MLDSAAPKTAPFCCFVGAVSHDSSEPTASAELRAAVTQRNVGAGPTLRGRMCDSQPPLMLGDAQTLALALMMLTSARSSG